MDRGNIYAKKNDTLISHTHKFPFGDYATEKPGSKEAFKIQCNTSKRAICIKLEKVTGQLCKYIVKSCSDIQGQLEWFECQVWNGDGVPGSTSHSATDLTG